MISFYALHLSFPNCHPFDKADFRWAAFIGEFLRPLLADLPSLQCGISYYGRHAEFYVVTADFSEIEPHIAAAVARGFIVRDMKRSLGENFGSARFLGPNSESNPTQRAELILASLRSICDLLNDSIIQREDGYWEFELNGDAIQNPIGNHFFSLLHLFHVITQTKALIYPLQNVHGEILLLDYYTFHNSQDSLGDFRLLADGQQCLP
jgi:hypothetical protein